MSLKTKFFYLDLFLLLVSWSFPLFFVSHEFSHLIYYYLSIPIAIQLIVFMVLGNYDDHFGIRLHSRRRVFINAVISYGLTFFIFKFLSLSVVETFYVRVRFYLLLFYPLQIALYTIIKSTFMRHEIFLAPQKIFVIGSLEETEKLKEWLKENEIKTIDFRITAYLDINGEKFVDWKTRVQRPFSTQEKLYDLIQEHELVVYFPDQHLDVRQARSLLRFGSESGSFIDFPTFCGILREAYPVDYINTEWLLRNSSFLWLKISFYLRFRQLLDFIGAFNLLLLTFPLWILAVIGIKISSPGPIFYTQERIGRFGRKFKIYKFRSMRIDAENSGPSFSQGSDDLRVTSFGKILRRTRIDELPQLINVLKGEMSLIGPRPEREHFEQQLMKDLPLMQMRNFVAPGITGLAQVKSGYANDVKSYKQKLGHDLFYILNINPFLDLTILIRTLRTVIFKPGS